MIDLYVKNEARKSQLGRLLLTAAAREGRVRGCRFIRLDVDARNRLAEGFYLRLGFQKLDGDSSFLLKADAFDALAGA